MADPRSVFLDPPADRAARRYWLVFGLPWPGDDVAVAHAAYAVAAPIPDDYVSSLIAQVFAVSQVYTERHPYQAVVWFSDLTRWLDTLDLSWPALGIDWQQALDELPHLRLPGVLLGVDRRTHLILCDASRHGLAITHPGGRHEPVTADERHRLHERMRHLLDEPAAEQPRPSDGLRFGAR